MVPATWDRARYAHAAHLLGRLAVSPRVAERADVGGHPFHVRDYVDGRLRIQVLPMLRDEGIWHHPLVAGAFDDALRARLLEAADRADEYVEELSAAAVRAPVTGTPVPTTCWSARPRTASC